MLRILPMSVLLLAGVAFSLQARADYWFKISDASQLQSIITNDQRVYLRNLSQFDGTVLGCCYNYWIDLTNDAGRTQWATFLAKIEAKESIWVFVPSQTQSGAVYLGDLG
jgi:hypothetical protein